MPIPFIAAALAVVTPIVKDVVMDVVKDVAMDIGKSFVDTISKGVKDVAGDVIGKGAKIVGDVIKNPLDALKDMGKKLLPPQFQMAFDLGKTLMQAATGILKNFMEKFNFEAKVGVGKDGVTAEVSASTRSSGAGETKGAGRPREVEGDPVRPREVEGDPIRTRQADESQRSGGARSGSSDPVNTKTGTTGGDITKMADLLRKDPDAFAKKYSDLTPNQLLALETKMKSMDRLFSSMSNLLAVEHDMKKSIISNFRV